VRESWSVSKRMAFMRALWVGDRTKIHEGRDAPCGALARPRHAL
jgi:hypothetical protein